MIGIFSILFIWLALVIIVAVAASSRGRNALGWGILAFFFSPLLAGLFLLALPNRRMLDLYEGMVYGREHLELMQQRRAASRERQGKAVAVVILVFFALWTINENRHELVDRL